MKKVFECRCDGIPIAQPRPIVKKKGKAISNHGKVVGWKNILSYCFMAEMSKRCRFTNIVFPLTSPLTMSLVFEMPPPRTVKKPDGGLHLQTPDLDNLTKAVKDELEKSEVVKNDSQIAEYVEPFKKIWSNNPGVTIILFEGDST